MTNGMKLDEGLDALLLIKIKQNSRSAFNQLVERYWETAYSGAYRRLKDADQANALVRDIFTHVWMHRATDRIGNFPAWLNTAVRKKVIETAIEHKATHSFFAPWETFL